jgi:Syntaxin 6, N-terminal
MSTDPYHAVQHEIQNSLQSASTLRASYLRIRSTARDDSEELIWARNEVKKYIILAVYVVSQQTTPIIIMKVESDLGRHGSRLGRPGR